MKHIEVVKALLSFAADAAISALFIIPSLICAGAIFLADLILAPVDYVINQHPENEEARLIAEGFEKVN